MSSRVSLKEEGGGRPDTERKKKLMQKCHTADSEDGQRSQEMQLLEAGKDEKGILP